MVPSKRILVEIGGAEDAATTFARDQLLMLAAAGDGAARARVWRRGEEGLLLGRFHRAALRAAVAGRAEALPTAAGSAAGSASGLADPGAVCADSSASRSGAGSLAGATAPAAAGDNSSFRAAAALRAGLSRRLSGGRIVPVGPGVVCITVAAPLVDWFDPAGASLRPDQVLNRALRPLLAMLRDAGVDAYYPGRDLVTAGGLALAHASFTVLRDGVALVEMHLAESAPFSRLPDLLDRFDPDGVAATARDAFAASTTFVRPGVAALSMVRSGPAATTSAAGVGVGVGVGVAAATPAVGSDPAAAASSPRSGLAARSDAEWASRFAVAAAEAFACEARMVGEAPAADAALASGLASSDAVTMAEAAAAADFSAHPGPAGQDYLVAAAVEMLGVVECSARLRGDRLTGLELTGDLIAPFHTVDDIASECEGEPLRPAYVRKALARVMARPRNFLLGIRDLDALILRLG